MLAVAFMFADFSVMAYNTFAGNLLRMVGEGMNQPEKLQFHSHLWWAFTASIVSCQSISRSRTIAVK